MPNPLTNPGLVSDCETLLRVKDALRGTDPLNWSADRAVTSWEGITVGGTPRRVTQLVLDRITSASEYGRPITLTGTIPPELGSLSNLERLTLSRHNLTGPIPPELGNLTELTDLQLYGNELAGGIPPELGNLTKLTRLDVSGNPLRGGIPVELGKLTNLWTLRLSNNQLTGSIPASLGALTSLLYLNLYGNTSLTGCIPASLRGVPASDLQHLGLDYCTTTTTYTLTVSEVANGRTSPLPGEYLYLSGSSATVTAAHDSGYRISSWGGDCSGTASNCVLTMDAAKTASVTFVETFFTATTTAAVEGSVDPAGTTTHRADTVVTVTASWDDATRYVSWGGDCTGNEPTCTLTMDTSKTATATFPERCMAGITDPTCIRVVYAGGPHDHASVSDIPENRTFTPTSEGLYQVGRGEQITVVTAARLPTGWTRFYLQRTPLEHGTPSPLSYEQLIPPVGTTYTFTPTTDTEGATLITFDLTAAKPHPVRPSHKPILGEVVVRTQFEVVSCDSGVAVPDPTTNTALAQDCVSLLAVRDTLMGTATLNWSAARPITQWEGVSVEGTPQRVTKLKLAASGLTGRLPTELGDLTALTEFHLNDNDLTGVIPSSLENLTDLTHAYLSGNDQLRGCVPQSFQAAPTNDASSSHLKVCSQPFEVSRKLVTAEGTYRLGRVVFDVPADVSFNISVVDGTRYLFLFDATDTTSFSTIIDTAKATMSFTFEGLLHHIFHQGNLYTDFDGPPTSVGERVFPMGGTLHFETDPAFVPIAAPALPTGGPSLEDLRFIARSLRIEPLDDQVPGHTTTRSLIPPPLPNELNYEPRHVRNLIVGEPIEVCSDYPLATRGAMAMWNTKVSHQIPDEVSSNIFEPFGPATLTPPANSDCDADRQVQDRMKGVPIRRTPFHGMLNLGCFYVAGGNKFPTDACALSWTIYRSRPYWTTTDGWVAVLDHKDLADTDDGRAYLRFVIAHELGHIWGAEHLRPCDPTDPTTVTVMMPAGSDDPDHPCYIGNVTSVGSLAITAADLAQFNAHYNLVLSVPTLRPGMPFVEAEGPGTVRITFDSRRIRTAEHVLIQSTAIKDDWFTDVDLVATLSPLDYGSDDHFSETFSGQAPGFRYYRAIPTSHAHLTNDAALEGSVEVAAPPVNPIITVCVEWGWYLSWRNTVLDEVRSIRVTGYSTASSARFVMEASAEIIGTGGGLAPPFPILSQGVFCSRYDTAIRGADGANVSVDADKLGSGTTAPTVARRVETALATLTHCVRDITSAAEKGTCVSAFADTVDAIATSDASATSDKSPE